MKKLFEKWACRHKWETHAKKEEVIPHAEYNPRTGLLHNNPTLNKNKTTEILICECGKVKKIVY